MAGRQRTTFNKLQRERARQAKQAAKRARRQGMNPDGTPFTPEERPEAVSPWDDPGSWTVPETVSSSEQD